MSVEGSTDGRYDPLASGVIDVMILSMAGRSETYGYEITQRLVEAGLRDVSEATVYTGLKRLERGGWLISERRRGPNGRARRYYRTTALGDRMYAERMDAWEQLVRVVEVVTTGEEDSP